MYVVRRGSPCFSNAGVHPHQNLPASVRSFRVSLPSCSKHRQQTHQHQAWHCNAPPQQLLVGFPQLSPRLLTEVGMSIVGWAWKLARSRTSEDPDDAAFCYKLIWFYRWAEKGGYCVTMCLRSPFCNEVERSRCCVSHGVFSMHVSLLGHWCSHVGALRGILLAKLTLAETGMWCSAQLWKAVCKNKSQSPLQSNDLFFLCYAAYNNIFITLLFYCWQQIIYTALALHSIFL